QQNVRDMVASGAPWQLVTTFNEWGEGTAVESATEWQSGSGYGAYLDALHTNGQGGAVPTATAAAGGDPVLLAAGDISSCASTGDEQTAKLLDAQSGIVATLGDNAYESGTSSEFANCFNPSWGQYKARIKPAVGNHEYATAGASGYYGYFGAAAGTPSKGYYSYELGAWHIVVINSNCSQIGGCNAGSPQEQWLRADLAAHPAACTLAYWHHPRFSSGAEHGNDGAMAPLWQALYDQGAELVLSGHDHDYERFAPQTPNGTLDPSFGIREFVVGTGGKSHYPFGSVQANSQVRNNTTYGILKLTLHASGYDWQFLPVAGGSFTDAGSGACHGAPTASAWQNARVSLSQTRGTVNSRATAIVSGFPPDHTLYVRWDGTLLGTFSIDGAGVAIARFRIPAAPKGIHTVRFSATGVAKVVEYEVVPRIKLIPHTAARGQTIDVSLRGYGAHETVRIRWKRGSSWIQVTQVMTSSTGSANVKVKVPTWATDGQASVRGDGSFGRAQTNAFDVVGGS
ncbi:MAG: metallophosphoesterase family protein, partial [Thermomicrobiales bacterium]